jgi:hypothetical protein
MMQKIQEILGTIQEAGAPDAIIEQVRHRIEESGATHPWAQICAALQADENENQPTENTIHSATSEIVQQVGQALLNVDELNWPQRVEWCKTPDDFLRLFEAVGIPDEKWKSPTWMTTQARLSPEEGGIGRTLSGLAYAIKKRFEYHSKFVAWMEGKSFTSIRKGIKACKTREDFLRVFAEIGIPSDNWKNTGWLYNKAKLPPEEGGIGQQLGHIPQYINDDDRFESFPHFVAWMEGKDELEGPLTERVVACETPQDFLDLFAELGVPGDNWMNTKWLGEKARLPVEEGGIGRNLVGFVSAIRKDGRFDSSYRKFVAWMEGKDELDPSMVGRVRECNTREDFLTMFEELGVPGDKWRTSTWLTVTAKLPLEEGGVGNSLSGIVAGIKEDEKFESFPHFVAWMDGKTEPPKSWSKKVAACRTQQDFLDLFNGEGIPGEAWRNHDWLSKTAKEPREKGGIDKHLSGLAQAFRLDSRFGGFREFIAWMDGKDAPDPTTRDRIQACETREDFRAFFEELGIPGGIGRSMEAVAREIRNDSRFKSYPRFVKWMEGEELSDDFERPQREQWIGTVRSCETPESFLHWFRELGILGDEWKNSSWLTEKARLPLEEGGIGRNISGIAGAIRSDGRFESFPHFVAWMEGKEKPDLSNRQKVEECKTREDFRRMFASLGVPGDEWRNTRWFTDTAKLPPEEGGVGKEGLTSLPAVIGEDNRFGSYPHFVAWMDGKDEVEKPIVEQVRNCITPDDFRSLFKKMGIVDDSWRSDEWMRTGSQKPPDEGGINKKLGGLSNSIRSDNRFGSFRRFLAWMDGNEELDDTLMKRAQACQERNDYLSLFEEVGIPNGRWKSNRWLQSKPVLKTEEGEVAVPLEGIVIAVRERFDSHKKFVAWMEGKDEVDLPWKERIAPLNTPQHFIEFFRDIGIPGEEWKNSNWLQSVAVKAPENGGIGQPLQGLADALRKRFESHPKFVAWMEGKDGPEETMVDVVTRCRTPDDFLQFFREMGLPEDAWRISTWFTHRAKLPPEEGGIGRNMAGFPGAIKNDERWDTYSHFKGWMQRKAGPVLSYPKQVALLETREDFIEWFADLGIPDDKWKDGPWLSDVARLPVEEGGIGKSMAAMVAAIRDDERFGGYPQFIAWMEGEEYVESLSAKVKRCKTKSDYLRLFDSLGIPGNLWRNTNWIRNVAPLPVEEGGIATNLHGLPFYVRQNNSEFVDYPHFVSWMDGMPLNGIQSPQEAELLLRAEAERLGVTVDDLLDEEKIHEYMSESLILRNVMKYFSSLDDN